MAHRLWTHQPDGFASIQVQGRRIFPEFKHSGDPAPISFNIRIVSARDLFYIRPQFCLFPANRISYLAVLETDQFRTSSLIGPRCNSGTYCIYSGILAFTTSSKLKKEKKEKGRKKLGCASLPVWIHLRFDLFVRIWLNLAVIG